MNTKKTKSGFSLIEILVTLSIVSIIGVILTKMNVLAIKANKSNELRSDLQDIKRTIINRLHCQQTFMSFGTSRPINCSSGTLISIKDKSGNLITNNGTVGEWNIIAKCEVINSKNGLSMYATKQRSDGNFNVDPLAGRALDGNHPISSLFKPDVRLCNEYFELSDDGWVTVPPFDRYATVQLPPAANLPGNPVFTVRYGVTSNEGNYSPNQWCIKSGYKYSTGVCRGRTQSSTGTFLFEGLLISNTVVGNWSYACQYGLPNYFWADPDIQILCK